MKHLCAEMHTHLLWHAHILQSRLIESVIEIKSYCVLFEFAQHVFYKLLCFLFLKGSAAAREAVAKFMSTEEAPLTEKVCYLSMVYLFHANEKILINFNTIITHQNNKVKLQQTLVPTCGLSPLPPTHATSCWVSMLWVEY